MPEIMKSVVMPFEPEEMLADLLQKYQCSLEAMANKLQVSLRTLYRLQKGQRIHPKVISAMIRLYCEFKYKTDGMQFV